MDNSGKTVASGAACQTCKTRRIKCDGGWPTCQRCIKSNRACAVADAVKQQFFAIHVENQYAAGEKKRPRGPRSCLIPAHPRMDLKSRARAYYIQNHLHMSREVPEVVKTWGQCFRSWEDKRRPSPLVDSAFLSLALAVFARSQQCQSAGVAAHKSYISVLQHMRSQIARLDGDDSSNDAFDAALLGAHFMSQYESLVQSPSEMTPAGIRPRKIWSHIDGAAAILRKWHRNRHRLPPTVIVRQTRRKLVKSALLRGETLPHWLLEGCHFGEMDIALVFDQLITRFVIIRHECSLLQARSSQGLPRFRRLSDLIAELQLLDRNIRAWAAQFPSAWSPTEHNLQNTLDHEQGGFWVSHISTCTEVEYVAVWYEYYTLRMLTAHAQLQLMDVIPTELAPSFGSDLRQCQSQLRVSVDSIASFIPYCLNRNCEPGSLGHASPKPYSASLVVWPASIASGLQYLDLEQRSWFFSSSLRASKASGECLLAYATNEYWDIA